MIRILVDSSADYTGEELFERDFELVPLDITMGDRSYRDCIEISRKEIYEYMLEATDVPKTSQPSPQSFLEAFAEAKERGDELICILISSALSGTLQSATLAKSMVQYEGIHLIDSLSVSYGIRILADHAKHLADEGLSASEIVERVEMLRSRLQIVAGVDTLTYLSRGGRISKAAASIGEMASVKPTIRVEEGSVVVAGRHLGRAKALSAIVKHVQEHPVDTDFPLYTLYSHYTENCELLEGRLTNAGYPPTMRAEIGAAIGVHVGPGAFAAIYVGKE